MKLKPIGNRIIVKRVVKEKKTESGLILPESSLREERFEVIEVGKESSVAKGDTIYVERYQGTEIKYGDETFIILEEKDILAIEM